MARHLLWILGFGVVIFQTTIFNWVIPSSWVFVSYHITLHFTLFFVIMLGLFTNRYLALGYGISLGLCIDMIGYGNMLGIYAFGLGLTGYLVGLFRMNISDNFNSHVHISLLGMLFFELINYISNRLFKTIDHSLLFVIIGFILPSILFNVVFVVLFYFPFRKWIRKLSN